MPDDLYFRGNNMCDYLSAVAGLTSQDPLANLLLIKIKFSIYLFGNDLGI